MDRIKIIKNYFGGMFIIDLLSSIPFGLLNENDNSLAEYGTLFKILKIIRFFRLIKVFKVMKGMTLVKNFLKSPTGR